MGFLTTDDYQVQLRTAIKNVITDNDETKTQRAENYAQSEAENYLSGRFDMAIVFRAVNLFDPLAAYAVDDRVYFNADAWVVATTYAANALVSYNNKVYIGLAGANTGNQPDTVPAAWALAADNKSHYIVNTITVAGETPATAASFTQNDDRLPVLVMYMVDMVTYHLHTNISPRNIPEKISERYDAAKEWLDMILNNKLNPGLPVLVGDEDGNFNAGSATKYSAQW